MAQKVEAAAAVAVTNMIMKSLNISIYLKLAIIGIALLASAISRASVLPEDRTDLLYHSYDGGGVTITGPSLLVRKGFKDTVSVYANYYVDQVSSASIDVLTSGSKYSEERTETSIGIDYLHNKTIMTLNVSNSSENDYEADTVYFGVSQDFFGDLTTLSLGYSQGDDLVMQNKSDFKEEKTTKRFKLGISQILTRKWTLALNAESVIDQGYLNNPYRQIRAFDGAAGNVAAQGEVYPTTRNSDSVALTSMYYLPYRAAIKTEARIFSDSWGIEANNFELGYIHPFNSLWTFEGKVRLYSQGQADFYSDIFAYLDKPLPGDPLEQRARDKELSKFSSVNIGLGVVYETDKQYIDFIENTIITLQWDRMSFDYKNFRNALLSQSIGGAPAPYKPGEEPLYSLNANVLRFNVSIFY